MSLCCTVLFLPVFALFVAFLTPALAQDLPPGDFRAVPNGTRLTYDDLLCLVGSAADFTVECTTSPSGDVGRGRLTIVGFAAVVGKVTPVGFMRPLQSANIVVRSLTLEPQALPAIASLWPLAVGKAATFDVEAEIINHTSGYFGQDKKCACALHATARVVGTATADLSGESLSVYVVETTTAPFSIPSAGLSALKWTFWYAPSLGAPLMMRTEWTRGPLIGQVAESELWRAELPGG